MIKKDFDIKNSVWEIYKMGDKIGKITIASIVMLFVLSSAFAADTLGVWEGSTIDASSHAQMDLALDLTEEGGNAKYEVGFGAGSPPENFSFDTNVIQTADVSMRIIDAGDDMGKAIAEDIYAYWKIRSAADFTVSIASYGNLSGAVAYTVSAEGIDMGNTQEDCLPQFPTDNN